MTLQADERGRITTKSQLVDYCQCGDGLTDSNIIEYFVNTYEIDIDGRGERSSISNANDRCRRGCPCHERVRYLPGHPKALTKQHIVRGANHNTLPNFIGRYFPPRDDPDEYPLYCACMLMLLKPWRCLESDLKLLSQTWESAFVDFLSTVSPKTRPHAPT